MMRKLCLLMVVLGVVVRHAPLLYSAPTADPGRPTLSAKTASNQPHFTRQYEGLIGKTLKVRLSLQRQGKALTGSYRYLKVGSELRLKGTVGDGGLLTMHEFDARGRQTGLFKGRLVVGSNG